MNYKQYRKVKSLLAKDCQITGLHLDGDGKTCAVGCLGLAINIPKVVLMKSGGVSVLHPYMTRFERRLGLGFYDLLHLQAANDSKDERKPRVARVLKQLDKIYEEHKEKAKS